MEQVEKKEISLGDLDEVSDNVEKYDYNINVDWDGDVRVRADRNYDFSSRIQEPETDYIEQDNELTEVLAEIKYRQESSDDYNKPTAFHITGPPGSAKTMFFDNLSEKLDAPLFTIQGRERISKSDLVGSLTSKGGDIWWEDGVIAKTLLSSQENLTICLIDEFNRMRPSDRSMLYRFLDRRNQISIGVRGDEIIEGNPDNLIIGATSNRGDGHIVKNIDDAEPRRLGSHIELNHLGQERKEKEAKLVQEKSGVAFEMAYLFVDVANYIRDCAEENSRVTIGVPTDSVIQWSRASMAYNEAGIDNPIMKAAEKKIINAYYNEANDEMSETIREVVSTAFGEDTTPILSEFLEKIKEDNIKDYTEGIDY